MIVGAWVARKMVLGPGVDWGEFRTRKSVGGCSCPKDALGVIDGPVLL